MVFADSTGPDITEGLPAPLARRITEAAGYVQNGAKYDVAIGGLPFLLAINDQRQYQRATADFRKQQFDTSKESGEQSLDQWWVRDQSSWHRGAGINFYEPGADDGTQYRFKSSAGVDVWTRGQVTLLRRLDSVATVTAGQGAETVGAVVGGVDSYFTTENGVVKRRTISGPTSYTGAIALTRVALAGTKIVVGTSTKIAAADASGSTFTDLWTNFTAAPTPYWAKSRIIVTAGPSLYELTLAGGDAGAATPLHTHPDAAWVWTGVAEAPSAILASGRSNGRGAIYRFSLEDAGTGTTPKLGQAYQVAEFPPGEEVHSIRVYLGTYVAIGTSKGLRVGVLDANGDIQYGPLIFSTVNPVKALSARDSFIYAGVQDGIDGSSGVVRVNLAEPVDDSGLRFAYANDVSSHTTGSVSSVAFLGNTDRVTLAVAGKGVWLQSDTNFESTGYVTSGAIRYATTESKSFRRMKARVETNGGLLSVQTVGPAGNAAFIFSLGDDYNTDSDIAITTPTTGQPYLSFILTLLPGVAGTTSPRLEGLQVKALPQIRRQRLISFPLLCTDREVDRNGIRTGYKGGAANRLFALESLEDLQAVVQVEDFTSGESFQAQIEKVEMDRNTPPSKRGSNFGGYITVTCRRL